MPVDDDRDVVVQGQVDPSEEGAGLDAGARDTRYLLCHYVILLTDQKDTSNAGSTNPYTPILGCRWTPKATSRGDTGDLDPPRFP